ncbi:MAG: hypothetical protein OEW48_20705 [Phycisphaerae bacterium]|nr:hypothetical protein [Phycisphaerae bacterium]
MGIAEFKRGLEDLGLSVEGPNEGRLIFDYTPDVGKFAGQKVKIGLTVQENWQASPPTGPRVSPRILPILPDGGQPHPVGGVHEAKEYEQKSAGEAQWEYWSRPFPNWEKTDRSVRAYMRHIRALFAKII